ncbi:hypothetical protein P3S67_007502 [Capsicum chacoense]
MTGETRTLGYMVPEVLNGNPYNRKCNMYSFGICLWEIYCCDKPYPDLSFSEVTSVVVRQVKSLSLALHGFPKETKLAPSTRRI